MEVLEDASIEDQQLETNNWRPKTLYMRRRTWKVLYIALALEVIRGIGKGIEKVGNAYSQRIGRLFAVEKRVNNLHTVSSIKVNQYLCEHGSPSYDYKVNFMDHL